MLGLLEGQAVGRVLQVLLLRPGLEGPANVHGAAAPVGGAREVVRDGGDAVHQHGQELYDEEDAVDEDECQTCSRDILMLVSHPGPDCMGGRK